MRISGLSAVTGVPVATIKYYLREGLLPAGTPTSATQATYGPGHTERLRLIRALLETGGLSVAATREVLDRLDSENILDALARTQELLPPPVGPDVDVAQARGLLASVGWDPGEGSAALRQLAAALSAVAAAGLPMDQERFAAYARAAKGVAEHDLAGLPSDSTAAALTYAVIGTVLYEPVLLALRRLAHQQESVRLLEPGERAQGPAARTLPAE